MEGENRTRAIGRDRRQRGTATAGLAIALALVASVVWAGHLAGRLRAPSRSITVKGFAEQPIESDVGVWAVRVVARSPSLAEAYERLESSRARVRAALLEAGFAEERFSFSSASIGVHYRQNEKGWNTNEVEGYELHQSASVESPDVALVERTSKTITSLIREGIEVTSDPPNFYYTGLDALKIEMVGAAARDARARAERLAQEGGASLGELASATQGVFQITSRYSSEVSAGGMYDTHSPLKNVRAVLTATFAVR
ncbi:MAG: SIMPL domain-containing protein [bacterium]|nr:SIMPL domain-containing protein [bacterium]